LQLDSDGAQTHAVVVSTLMEAWGVVHSGLVADLTVQDVSKPCKPLFASHPFDILLMVDPLRPAIGV
jgi:hypothetical protein